MSKLPDPNNDIFNHEFDNIEASTGVDVNKAEQKILDMSEEYFELSTQKGYSNVSTLAELAMKNLTHKELAVLWSKNIFKTAYKQL